MGKKIITEEVSPLRVAIIGTGDGKIPPETTVKTPDSMPNLIVNGITPLLAISIRFVNIFLMSVLGIVSGGAATKIIPFDDFWDLLLKSMILSLTPSIIGLIKDLVTIFKNLENKYPLLTGSV